MALSGQGGEPTPGDNYPLSLCMKLIRTNNPDRTLRQVNAGIHSESEATRVTSVQDRSGTFADVRFDCRQLAKTRSELLAL